MPSIEIRDLSEETYDKLERLAFATGQSVAQYVRALVLRETRQPAGAAPAGPADQARARRARQAFGGDAAADAREAERWRDL